MDLLILVIRGNLPTHSSSKINFRPLPSDDPKQRKPDITLAKEKLLWEPKTLLDDGLEMTIDYFKNLIKS